MSDDLGHSEEIVEISQIHDLLHTAYIHQWPFFYMSIVKNHLDSRSTKLLEVELKARSLLKGRDVHALHWAAAGLARGRVRGPHI